MQLFESERRIMEILWTNGPLRAGDISKVLSQEINWNRNTTYTVIKKCIEKGLIERSEPGYLCTPILTKKQLQKDDLETVLEKSFDGSVTKLFRTLLSCKQISKFDIKKMKKTLKKAEEKLL